MLEYQPQYHLLMNANANANDGASSESSVFKFYILVGRQLKNELFSYKLTRE